MKPCNCNPLPDAGRRAFFTRTAAAAAAASVAAAAGLSARPAAAATTPTPDKYKFMAEANRLATESVEKGWAGRSGR